MKIRGKKTRTRQEIINLMITELLNNVDKQITMANFLYKYQINSKTLKNNIDLFNAVLALIGQHELTEKLKIQKTEKGKIIMFDTIKPQNH